jgi:hypothetical protein
MLNSMLIFCVLPHQHTPTRFISALCTKVPYKCSNSNNKIADHAFDKPVDGIFGVKDEHGDPL